MIFTTETLKAISNNGCANKSLTLFFAILLFSLPVFSQTYEWIAGTGNWDEPTNWYPEGVPGNGDEVLIINGGTVFVNGSSRAIAVLNLEDGTIAGTQELSVEEFYWYGGQIEGSGDFEVTGLMFMDEINPLSLSGRTLKVVGECTWVTGDLDILPSGTFQVTDGGSFSVEHGGNKTIGASGGKFQLDLGGTFTNGFHSVTTIGGKFDVDDGNVIITNGSINLSGATTNAWNDCNLSIAKFGKLFANDGTLSFGEGTVASGEGAIEINGGTLQCNGNNTIASRVNVMDGTLGVNTSTLFSGPFTWSGGTIIGAGTASIANLTINATGDVALDNTTILLTSSGMWGGGNILLGGGALFQTASGTNFSINHVSSQSISSSGTASVVFAGSVTKSGSSLTQVNCEVTVTGSASLKIDGGIWQTLSGSTGTYQSSVRVLPGATLDVSGGYHDLTSGTVYGGGTLLISGGTMVCAPGTKMINPLVVTGGTLSNATNIFPPTLTMSGGTISTAGNVMVGGAMTWSSGTMSGIGTVTVNGECTFQGGTRILDGATLRMQADGDWQGGDFSFANGALLHVTTATTFMITHSGTQQATGSGTVQLDGVIEKYVASSTTNILVDYMHNGTAIGNGNISFGTLINHGVVAPGFSIGLLSVNQFDNSDALLNIEITGTGTRGTNFDGLEVSGSGMLGGTLNVTLLNGFVPVVGHSFHIVDCQNCSGQFNTINLPTIPNDRRWEVDYDDGVTVRVEQLLPVELTAFSVRLARESIDLAWSTASETNNKGFFVERNNGENGLWEMLGFVEGRGHSLQSNHYGYADKKPLSGNNYYRLRQMDTDGTESFSPIRHIVFQNSEDAGPMVFPNPAKTGSVITLRFSNDLEGTVAISIFDQQGRLVHTQLMDNIISGAEIILSDAPFKPGFYTVAAAAPTQSSKIKLVVK